MFNKPAGRAGAAEHLRALSGRTHALHAAVAGARNGDALFVDVSVARRTMRELSEDMIQAYLHIAGDAVTTSVGAYQLEGLGVHLFSRIDGDHFTILGLPLLPLLAFLRGQGLLSL
jgi:septum formation protein